MSRFATYPSIPSLTIEFRLRFDGCHSALERTQRFSPMLRYWGKQPHIAIVDDARQCDVEHLNVTVMILAIDTASARRDADTLLEWVERNLNGWLEDFEITTN